ncbi:hypothetical protein EYB25_007393 [Talaromyces marneffei]|uniref:Uncharacterized protein n=2 Tax=Talaromyces marneffei TaxID=37727 RepID=B6QMZ7_TALMQ|nr:uncharacterized protein EYB26_008528 [Talaromyces marneffei]EEA21337.1 conserved hypothetical protein [Talaromyces marneffei ATCC 18224]KAE8551159.1 hypothetical protein EYB25_007393 [Talaromyces marneffei]QGA20820.1 hypothetical protein EYB26_008528 [Talaromyces marneffei]
MSDKLDAQHVDAQPVNAQPAKPQGFLGKVLAHFKRWWWVHLIIFAASVLIVSLPLVYIGYPRIAQDAVNRSTLNITRMAFSEPTPNTIRVNQTQVLGNKAIYHPKIFEFNATITLVGSSAPLAVVVVPQSQAEDGAVIHFDTVLNLQDINAVTNFSRAVLSSEEFQLNVFGRPQLQEGPLPKTTVTFNKTITMKGMGGLKGFELQNMMISLTPAADGTNMNGTVFIPNPSVVSVELGNVTLNVYVNDTLIGNTFINNVTLMPGDNHLPLRSSINQTQVLSFVTGTAPPYPGGILPIIIRGNSSVYGGVEIPYFSKALQSNPLTTQLNITDVLIQSGLGAVAGVL